MNHSGQKEKHRLDQQCRRAGEKLLRTLHSSKVQALVELALDEDGLASGVLLTLMPEDAMRLAKLLATCRKTVPWWKRGEV